MNHAWIQFSDFLFPEELHYLIYNWSNGHEWEILQGNDIADAAHRYGSATFAEAADCTQEVLSPPDPAPPSPTPPRPTQPDCETPANDPAGKDGPIAGKFPNHEHGDLPNELDCAEAYDLTDFVLSSFHHPESIPKDCIELWARLFARVSQGLIDALDYSGPDREDKIGTAARWYLGLPQLMLRDNGRTSSIHLTWRAGPRAFPRPPRGSTAATTESPTKDSAPGLRPSPRPRPHPVWRPPRRPSPGTCPCPGWRSPRRPPP